MVVGAGARYKIRKIIILRIEEEIRKFGKNLEFTHDNLQSLGISLVRLVFVDNQVISPINSKFACCVPVQHFYLACISIFNSKENIEKLRTK